MITAKEIDLLQEEFQKSVNEEVMLHFDKQVRCTERSHNKFIKFHTRLTKAEIKLIESNGYTVEEYNQANHLIRWT